MYLDILCYDSANDEPKTAQKGRVLSGGGKQGCCLILALSHLVLMDFYCGTCNEKLTRKPLHEADAKKLQFKDGEEALSDDSYLSPEDFGFILWIPVTHIVSTQCLRLVNHHDPFRFQGCCGPSMMEQYNQVCSKCSTPIGVVFADCWAPHFTAVNAAKLSTKPKW